MSITDELAIGLEVEPFDEQLYREQEETIVTSSPLDVKRLRKLTTQRDVELFAIDLYEEVSQHFSIETISSAVFKMKKCLDEIDGIAREKVLKKVGKGGLEIDGVLITEKNLRREFDYGTSAKLTALETELETAKKNLSDFKKVLTLSDYVDLDSGEIVKKAVSIPSGTTTQIEFINKQK